MKNWQIGSGFVKEPKVTVGPGITKDGCATGGVVIENNLITNILGTDKSGIIFDKIKRCESISRSCCFK